MAARRENYRQ
jgi:hypothetical protein